MNNYLILFLGIGLIGLVSVNSTHGQKAAFTHGVASGDPDHHSIVLWTRLVTADSAAAVLNWQVATDTRFNSPVAEGSAIADIDNDFCTKVIADGLQAGRSYFYRFVYRGMTSPIGRTKTLPSETHRIKIGVANCAKYTGGYYHAYEELARMDDLDVVIHLGDYIYESGPSVKGSSYWPAYQATRRQHDPPYECLSLQDYRTRYAQYRSDPSLQKLHARHPMITIWDDHEIAMKPLKKLSDGTLQYNGDWEGRKRNSITAYHEWLPIRVKPFEAIYRSFQFGDLVNLMMLDTRVCCKSEVTKTLASLKDTSRHIVGNEQLDWIEREVLTHRSKWNIFGNQLLMAEKDMGWNRWPGFPTDRNRLLQFIEDNPSMNFLVTTGNAHNPHHYIIFDKSGKDTLLHEVLPGSISSGNNAEKAFYDPRVLAKEEKRLKSASNVLWFHQDSHGFIVIDLTSKRAKVNWYFVSSIRKKEYELISPYSYTLLSNSE